MSPSTGSSQLTPAASRPTGGRESGEFSTLIASAGRFGTEPPVTPVRGQVGGGGGGGGGVGAGGGGGGVRRRRGRGGLGRRRGLGGCVAAARHHDGGRQRDAGPRPRATIQSQHP